LWALQGGEALLMGEGGDEGGTGSRDPGLDSRVSRPSSGTIPQYLGDG
jgi:hypothetical protein